MQRGEIASDKADDKAKGQQREQQQKQTGTSKHISDHLANERTFLAWLRTGIATIAFGFVVARFGLLLRELAVKNQFQAPTHYSSEIGVALTLLGVAIMIAALLSFLRNRRLIDAEAFHPATGYAIVLTVLATIVGVLLAFYLFFTA